MSYRRVGIIYHPVGHAAQRLAEQLRDEALGERVETWLARTGDEAALAGEVATTDLLVCVGGDGTVLWAARGAVPHPIPIISVNMGRLGFLSELDPAHAVESVRGVLDGQGMVEERAMIECLLPDCDEQGPYIALNDIVIGRSAPGRPVYLGVAIDGVHLARVRADAVILSTATGSTAYSLSAGGPVLMPQSNALLLTPVAPHLSRMRPIVLTDNSEIEVQVETDHSAVMSVDGRLDRPLDSGCTVVVRRSQHVARFLRMGPPGAFFDRLAHHLNLSTRHGESLP